MTVIRITNGFDQLSDPNLLTRVRFITGKLTGNPNFTDLNPALGTVATAINEFESAAQAAIDGNTEEKTLRDQKHAALINLMHLLSNCVLFQAKQDIAVIQSSGFSVARPSTPLPPMGSPVVKVESGANPGELKLGSNRLPAARAYNFQYTADPITENSVWTSEVVTKIKVVIGGLTSGQRYWCRVAAIGSNGQVMYSDVLSRIVL